MGSTTLESFSTFRRSALIRLCSSVNIFLYLLICCPRLSKASLFLSGDFILTCDKWIADNASLDNLSLTINSCWCRIGRCERVDNGGCRS